MQTSRYLRAALLGLLLLALIAGSAAAQNPNSCSSTGFSSYSFTTTFNPVTNTTTLNFTFCNDSPINGKFVNVGEVFVDGLPAPVSTTSPPGWEFSLIGGKTFWSTTSNPWWKTPPAIAPSTCLSGFSYTISGSTVPSFVVFTKVFPVTDATGQHPGGGAGGGFDCSVENVPPVNQPCIDITKGANPTLVQPNGVVTYTIRVCNCGNTDLNVTSLTDTILGNLLTNFKAANMNSSLLPTGACVTFTVQFSIPMGTPTGPLQNCATVVATVIEDMNGALTEEVTDTACATVTVGQVTPGPCLSLLKQVFPQAAAPTQTVFYQYIVCNCGNTPLTITSFMDDNPAIGNLLDDFIAQNNGQDVLQIGHCVEVCVPFTVPFFTPSPLLNCATVVGVPFASTERIEQTFCARLDINRFIIPIQCFLPVTFTQQGFNIFSNPCVPLFPCTPTTGTTLFDRFAIAFDRFKFNGVLCKNEIMIGDPKRNCVMFTGSNFGLSQLRNFFPQTGLFASTGKLMITQANPSCLLNKQGCQIDNILAGETLALTLNIAFNDARLMPRTSGVDLENFILTQGPYRGKTVKEVLNIANSVLGGDSISRYGLPVSNGTDTLCSILSQINANYEFQGFGYYTDKGYLKPNKPLGPTKPGHQLTLP